MHDDDLDALVEIATRPRTRAEPEVGYGEVWDEREFDRVFQITAIIPPTYIVRRRSDGVIGGALCQPRPKLFFRFRSSPPSEPA